MSILAPITVTSGNDTLTFLPAECKIDYDSLAGPDSGRSADGHMHINWILRKTTKLEIKLPPHRYDDPMYCSLFSLIQGQENIKVTFYDYISRDTRIDVLMYCSQTNAGYYYKGLITDASFELIDMWGETSVPHIQPGPIVPIVGEWTITFNNYIEGFDAGSWDVLGSSVFFPFKSNSIYYEYMYWSSEGEPSESNFFYNSHESYNYADGWEVQNFRTVLTDTDPATVFTGDWAGFLAANATVTHNT